MRGVIMHAPGDVRVEERERPTIAEPTDAVIRLAATCVCGSDLWPYRGIEPVDGPTPMGHEYVGVVEDIGADVRGVKVGDFVVGSFFASDGTCEICRAGYQSRCVHAELMGAIGTQAEYARVPLADGTLVATPTHPTPEQVPHLLAASDVLAARELGAERIIAMSRHEPRQAVARTFGATDVVAVRGAEGVEAVQELTAGIGADAVLECVGTNDAMRTALKAARPGAMVGYVGVPHGIELPVRAMFGRNVGVAGGLAPVRKYLPDLLERTLSGRIDPSPVFDLTLPLEQVAEGYRAMDERRAIKVMLQP
jgi:threonine dehydrogenase-like Zn-dependent dehydrogenase